MNVIPSGIIAKFIDGHLITVCSKLSFGAHIMGMIKDFNGIFL